MAAAANSLTNVQYDHIMDHYWSVAYADVDLIVDEASGYVNATKLCADNGSKFHNWYRYNNDFVDYIDKIYGITSMYTVKGGNDGHRTAVLGTYVKSEIIIAISIWLSNELYLNVSKIIEDCAIRRLNNTISERDHTIVEQGASLEQMNQTMVKRDHTIAEQGVSLEKMNLAVAERDQTIIEQSLSLERMNQTMIERDHTIAKQSQTIIQQSVSLEQMKTENIELNQTLAEKGQIIVHQEQTIDEMAVDSAKFQRFKHDIAPKAEPESVHHVLCIVFKNEEDEEYPFYVIRSQKRSVKRQFAGVRKRYPRCIELKRITYSPNAFNLFHRMKNFLDIRTKGNHVMLKTGYSPDRLPNDTSDLCVI